MAFRTSLSIFTLAGITAIAASAAGTSPGKAVAKPAKPAAERKGAPTYEKHVLPLLKKYCVNCHGPKQEIGGINVTAFKDEAAVVKARDIWEKIGENIHGGHMPPKNSPQPSAAGPTPAVVRTALTRYVRSGDFP